MEWISYPGQVADTIVDRGPALEITPGDSGYSRHVTEQRFVPPVKIAGWVKLARWDGARTPDPAVYDGLHLHLGHVGNSRSYVCSLVRRDGHAKIAVEYGWHGYTSLAYSKAGPELVRERTYLYEIVWLPNKITTWVASEAGVHTMAAKIPDRRRLPAGSVGFRLDNHLAYGDLTVRSL